MNNLNLIIGDSQKLVDFYLNDIIKKNKLSVEDKIEYDLSVSTLSDILDEASMNSLFSNKKLIIGRNLNIENINDDDIEYLKKYVENINKDACIILISKKFDLRLKKSSIFKDKFNIIDIGKKDNSEDILKYVIDYIKENGYTIDNYVAEYLVKRLNNDINNIKIELDKIFIYKGNDKNIDKNTIDLLTVDNIDDIVYEFTNAVLDKNYDKVLKMYGDFEKENLGFDYLLVSLHNAFRQSLIIKLLYNRGESNLSISKFIGKKEYYVKTMVERLYYYTVDDLCECISKLAQIDENYKTGKSNFDELKLFLMSNN